MLFAELEATAKVQGEWKRTIIDADGGDRSVWDWILSNVPLYDRSFFGLVVN